MIKVIASTLFITLLTTDIYGHVYIEKMEPKRDRLHSARKVIDSFSTLKNSKPSSVNSVKSMFENAKVSGQIKSIYASYDYKSTNDTYATAIGAILKYELAEFNGFNLAIAIYTSHDIALATGKKEARNPELSSSKGNYTELAEAYVNYKYKGLNIRLGRQELNTPLADSDEISMNKNSFEAYIMTYNFKGFEFMAGNIQTWQGYDAGLDTPWRKAGKDGTNLIGLSYNETLELNIWAYNITGETNSFYLDGGFTYNFNKNIAIHTMVQFLEQKELDNSGVETSIYGGLFEFIAYGFGLNVAYNKALTKSGKRSFSGLGGGALFTSMDTRVLDDITQNEDTEALVFGFVYEVQSFNFLYANGNFTNSSQHVKEQDIGAEYHISKELLVACILVMQEDKTDFDWNRLQLMLNYNF